MDFPLVYLPSMAATVFIPLHHDSFRGVNQTKLDLLQVYFFSSSVSHRGNNFMECEGTKLENEAGREWKEKEENSKGP